MENPHKNIAYVVHPNTAAFSLRNISDDADAQIWASDEGELIRLQLISLK